MSKIGQQLQALHKPAAPMGFGFPRASAPRRKMLLVASFTGATTQAEAVEVAAWCNAAVVSGGCADGRALAELLGAQRGDTPLGTCVVGMPNSREESDGGEAAYDFVVCDVSTPLGLVVGKDLGVLVEVPPEMDGLRLRALGDLGVDAVLLDARPLGMGTLSSLVECRRVRSASGKPLLVHVSEPVDADALPLLWQAGVDGLVVESTVGVDALTSLRSAIDAASFEPRTGSRGVVSIGTHVGLLGKSHEEEEDDDDDGDGEPDDE